MKGSEVVKLLKQDRPDFDIDLYEVVGYCWLDMLLQYIRCMKLRMSSYFKYDYSVQGQPVTKDFRNDRIRIFVNGMDGFDDELLWTVMQYIFAIQQIIIYS